MVESRRFRTGFAALVMLTLLAGDAWRYSISWWGFGVLAVLLTAGSVVILVRERNRWRLRRLPYPLLVFLHLITASLVWSFYPGLTALGILTTLMTVSLAVAMAVAYSWDEILTALGTGLKGILGLSLLFELVVSLVIRQPVLPLWVDYGRSEGLPKLLYWSRNELFEVFGGGRIQGIVGNASLLGFVSLLGLITFAIQLATGRIARVRGTAWLVVAVAAVLLTRSATITAAAVACALALAAVLVIRRTPREWTTLAYSAIALLGVVGVGCVLIYSGTILLALGKSDDLTGRIGIWQRVIELAQERPVLGWGWASYWMPWIAPFDDPAFLHSGVQQTHAHNAWLDTWLQLGLAGLVVLGALAAGTVARSWSFAAGGHSSARTEAGAHAPVTVLPLLVMVALIVQSAAESRLLVEYGMLFLVLFAVKTKWNATAHSPSSATVAA